jgi:hypothetical protein
MRRHVASISTVALTLTLTLSLACQNAAGAGRGPTTTPTPSGGYSTTQVIPSNTVGESSITATLTVSAPKLVTASSSAMALRRVGARRAIKAAPVYYITWEGTYSSKFWGVFWEETHKGLTYFDYNKVWQASRYGWDNDGYHRCGYGHGAGFSIDVLACYRHGDPSTTHITLGDEFKVSFIASGFPMSNTLQQEECINQSGRAWVCG